jgi:transcriptional regulator with XRE-family HTH domain
MRAKRDEASTARDAEAEILGALEEPTRTRIARIQQFADAIRSAIRNRRRQTDDLTQTELAKRLGVSVSTISRLESGRGIAGIDFAVALSALAELGAAPTLTLLDADAPEAYAVVDRTRTGHAAQQAAEEPRLAQAATLSAEGETQPSAASSGSGSREAPVSDLAASAGVQSELEAVREEMARLTKAVEHLSQTGRGRSTG